MHYTEGQQQAVGHARDALAKMNDNGIAPHPNNYSVWYAYHSGKMPDLVRTLDILAEKGQAFSEDRNQELFAKFFTGEGESSDLHDTAVAVEGVLTRLLERIGTAGEETAESGRQLEDLSGRLDEGDGEIGELLSLIIAETKRIQARNGELEGQLNKSTSEIGALRENLDLARQEAMTDALTGAANRKAFDQQIEREAAQAVESGNPLCLLMVDIDHFKHFNDRFGHQLGDQVLRLVARTLKDGIKGQDTAARYGGEEFAILLPNTEEENAATLADNLRLAVASKKVIRKSSGKELGSITMSIGVSRLRLGEALADFIGRADEALYAAKDQGRNRVVVEQPEGALQAAC